jgi:hypothetical protein
MACIEVEIEGPEKKLEDFLVPVLPPACECVVREKTGMSQREMT